jgi:hypothetical protein
MENSKEQYKLFVDDLVKLKPSVDANWAKRGYWPQTPDNEKINGFLARLSQEEREILATLLDDSRSSGIHDVLVYLQGQFDNGNMKIIVDNTEIANSPFGTELHYDWTCRVNGDEWPE